MKTITNKLKVALVAVGLLAVGTVSAQRTDTSTNAGTDFTKQANTVLGEDGGSVKVVDNKGTIKYLQASNGLTVFTDTAPNGGVITTWQLGGTLTDNTYITASATGGPGGNPAEFALNGLELVTAGTASTNAVDRGAHDDGAGATGFTVLIRDEATGAIQKIELADLFQVTAIRREATPPTNTNNGTTETIAVAGLPVIDATNEAKLFVFRNGVKLRWNTDFTATTAGSIDINISADLPIYAGDVIEVHYIN
ncbi:hypothetical protein [Tenacibaculum larymnensis]|uniref:Uncharacterized protein n=1 Tax=Tenacibaculum larymnensis TaxID=2878201 RepID=A0A9X4IQJ8_9FLAO|nr:hypothetical protein [Tenacibaculum larymnensis]MDE1206997.1 hypothetical protein [Tenacibaculum larymnensis]